VFSPRVGPGWGFRFEDIDTEVFLYHGEADSLAPVRSAHYIDERLRRGQVRFYPGEGHADPLTRHRHEIFGQAVETAGVTV